MVFFSKSALEKFFLFSKCTDQNVLKYLIKSFSAKKIFIFSSNPKALLEKKITYTFIAFFRFKNQVYNLQSIILIQY